MLIVDAHNHFWKYDAQQYAWISDQIAPMKKDFYPAELKAEMDKNGVSASVAIQARHSEFDTTFLLEQAEINPFIQGVVGWVDLTKADVEQSLDWYVRFPKLVGIRHLLPDEADEQFMLRKDFLEGAALLKEYDLTYDLLLTEQHLPQAIKFMEYFPDQKMILDHIAKPLIKAGKMEPWATYIKALAQNKNLYCKLSGLVTEADWQNWKEEDIKPYLDVVFEAFGASRLVYGSDWPICLLAANYTRVLELIKDYIAPLETKEQEMIMGLNAIQFYNI